MPNRITTNKRGFTGSVAGRIRALKGLCPLSLLPTFKNEARPSLASFCFSFLAGFLLISYLNQTFYVAAIVQKLH